MQELIYLQYRSTWMCEITNNILGKHVYSKLNSPFHSLWSITVKGADRTRSIFWKIMVVFNKGNKEPSTFSIMHPRALNGSYILTLGSIRGLIWCCNFFLVSFFSDFLVSAWQSAAVISFWRSCCFFSRSFFLASIFFSSFIRVCSSSICPNNVTIKILK